MERKTGLEPATCSLGSINLIYLLVFVNIVKYCQSDVYVILLFVVFDYFWLFISEMQTVVQTGLQPEKPPHYGRNGENTGKKSKSERSIMGLKSTC